MRWVKLLKFEFKCPEAKLEGQAKLEGHTL